MSEGFSLCRLGKCREGAGKRPLGPPRARYVAEFFPWQQGAIETDWKEIAGKKVHLYLDPLGSLHETKRIKREVLSVVNFPEIIMRKYVKS